MTELVDLLREQLAASAVDSAHVVAYRDLPAVDALWKVLSFSDRLQWSNILIVYDGQPEVTRHPFRPETWLTPWDWALAASTMMLRVKDRVPTSGFRCWIVDLLAGDGATAGRRRFKAAAAFAPWIRWYRPVGENAPLLSDLALLWTDVVRLSGTPSLSRASVVDATALESVWSAMFAAPGDRHAIGNLVGPLLLAEGIQARFGHRVVVPADGPTTRFRTLLTTVGLRGIDAETSTRGGAFPLMVDSKLFPQPHQDLFEQCTTLRFMLIDDQYLIGYHHVLSQLLFADQCSDRAEPNATEARWTGDDRRVTLRSSAQPRVLLDALRSAFAGRSDWRSPHSLAQAGFDVLFLDLRLFPGSTFSTVSPEEEEFLRELLDFCRGTRLTELGDYGIKAALQAAESRVAGGGEELGALTLLPLLLSHADPSLPIVLFSSTHQRDVVDAFRLRPNLITSFSKPVATGHVVDRAGLTAANDLIKALREAVGLHKIRHVWTAISDLSTVIAAGDTLIADPRLMAETGRITKPLSYRLRPQLLTLLQAEFQNLLARRRFADALMAPHNLLEYCLGSMEPLPPEYPAHDSDEARRKYCDAFASFQFYRVLKELRNARAHYSCRPILHDRELENSACWAWLVLARGLSVILSGGRPFVAGQVCDRATLNRARAAGWLQIDMTEKSERLEGEARCKEIIVRVGHLLREGVIATDRAEMGTVGQYALRVAAAQRAN